MNKTSALLLLLVLIAIIVFFILIPFVFGIRWEFWFKLINGEEELVEPDPCTVDIYRKECDLNYYCPRNPSNRQCVEHCRLLPQEPICDKEIDYCDLEKYDPRCIVETCDALGDDVSTDPTCLAFCSDKGNLGVPSCKDYYCTYLDPDEKQCDPDYCTNNPTDIYCKCLDVGSEECKKACIERPFESVCISSFCIHHPRDLSCTTCDLYDNDCQIVTFEGKIFYLRSTLDEEKYMLMPQGAPPENRYGQLWYPNPETGILMGSRNDANPWYLHKLSNGAYYLCPIIDGGLKLNSEPYSYGKISVTYSEGGIEFRPTSAGSKNTFYFYNSEYRGLTVSDNIRTVTLYGRTTDQTNQKWVLELVNGESPPSWKSSTLKPLTLGQSYYFVPVAQQRTMYLNISNCQGYQEKPSSVSLTFNSQRLTVENIEYDHVLYSNEGFKTDSVVFMYTLRNSRNEKAKIIIYAHEDYYYIGQPHVTNNLCVQKYRSEILFNTCQMVDYSEIFIGDTDETPTTSPNNAIAFRIFSDPPQKDYYKEQCVYDLMDVMVPPSCEEIMFPINTGVFRIMDTWSGLYLTYNSAYPYDVVLEKLDTVSASRQNFTIQSDDNMTTKDIWIEIKNNASNKYLDLDTFIKAFGPTNKPIRISGYRQNFMFRLGINTSTMVYGTPMVLQSSTVNNHNPDYANTYFIMEKV